MKTLQKIKRFIGNFLVYTTWKDLDKYPSLIYHNKFIQILSEISGYSFFRVHFWGFFAKRNQYFSGFYHGENKTDISEIDQLFSRGYVLKENFIDKEVHSKYAEIFQLEINNYLNSQEFKSDQRQQIRTEINFDHHNMKEFQDEFIELLTPMVRSCYGKITPTFRYELEVSKDGTDYESAFTKWHIDRNVPSLKSLYFPLGVSVAPFSFIEGSQKINDDWFRSEKFFRSIKNYNLIGNKTMVLRSEKNIELCSNYKENITELNNLAPNTFYLGAHHGLHRKKPFDSAGYRFHVTVEFTHRYTKFNLIRDGLKLKR